MLEVLEPCTIARVQTWDIEAIVPAALEHALGLTWPRLVGAVAAGRADVMCVGPTDWLVMSATPDGAGLLLTMDGAFIGTTFRATNVSSSLTRIQMAGPDMRTTLSKGCGLDLHPDVFTKDRSARTRLAGMPVIMRCREPNVFDLVVSVSYQQYLLAWLADASLDCAGERA